MAQQPPPTTPAVPSVWDRWLPVWHGFFYLALILSTAALLVGSAYTWWQYLLMLGLSPLLGIWYGWMAHLGPDYWRARPRVAMGALASGWVGWLLLCVFFPVYLFLLCGLYPQAFIYIRLPWKIGAGLILTMLVVGIQALAGGEWDGWLLISLGAGLTGVLIAAFIEAIAQQSEQRKRLIDALQATRQELADAERASGMLEERSRLAREIHDTFAQALTSLLMQLEAIERMPQAEVGALHHQFDQVRRSAQEYLAEARRVMWALQPRVLDQASLPEALSRLAHQASEAGHVVVEATITGIPHTLRPELEVTLLRTAQEALANIQKHANARAVTMTLSYMEDVVILDVQDDGVGFEPGELLAAPLRQTEGGYGLKALQERAEQLDGTFVIESSPGAGTTIAVTLPVLGYPLRVHLPAHPAHEVP
jgi:signal transduction histidine kinase